MFLYRDDPFYFRRIIPVLDAEREAINRGNKIFYLYGCIDYTDQFGTKHRSGYARRFERTAHEGEDNLVFVTDPGYNYDRERTKDEGHDWDRPT